MTCKLAQNYHHLKICLGRTGSRCLRSGDLPKREGLKFASPTPPPWMPPVRPRAVASCETPSQSPHPPSFPPCASQEPQQGTRVFAKGLFIAYRRKQKYTGGKKQADI